MARCPASWPAIIHTACIECVPNGPHPTHNSIISDSRAASERGGDVIIPGGSGCDFRGNWWVFVVFFYMCMRQSSLSISREMCASCAELTHLLFIAVIREKARMVESLLLKSLFLNSVFSQSQLKIYLHVYPV